MMARRNPLGGRRLRDQENFLDVQPGNAIGREEMAPSPADESNGTKISIAKQSTFLAKLLSAARIDRRLECSQRLLPRRGLDRLAADLLHLLHRRADLGLEIRDHSGQPLVVRLKAIDLRLEDELGVLAILEQQCLLVLKLPRPPC